MNESKQTGMWILILSQLVQINNTLMQANGYDIRTLMFTPPLLVLFGATMFLIGMIKDKGDESK